MILLCVLAHQLNVDQFEKQHVVGLRVDKDIRRANVSMDLVIFFQAEKCMSHVAEKVFYDDRGCRLNRRTTGMGRLLVVNEIEQGSV